MIASFTYALVALLVIIDPGGTAVLFIGLTPRDTPQERRRQALRGAGIAFLVLAIFGLAGETLMRVLGIGLPSLRVAGGILLFLTAADMVTAKGLLRATPDERRAAERETDISVFPLAIPFIAGPGAMTTMVLLHSQAAGDPLHVLALEAALAVAILATVAALLLARHVASVLGEAGANVIGRVLGVLLAAMSAQLVLDGIRQSLHLG